MAALRLTRPNGSTRLSRRQVLAAVTLSLSGSLQAACSGNNGPTRKVTLAANAPTSNVAPPAKGGVLRAAYAGDAYPAGAPLTLPSYYINYPVLEQLVRYRHDLTAELVLVDEWDFSTDKTRLVARLKPGLTFHNGAPVTSDDMLFAVDVQANPDKYGVAPGPYGPFAQRVVDKKVLDKRTAEFQFDKPRVNNTDLFVNLPITPATMVADLVAGKDVQGTGPFRFVNMKPNESIRLEANRNWHGTDKEGGPFLDAIDVRIFADADAMGLAFDAGELDLILLAPPNVAARYKAAGQVHIAPKIGVWYLGAVASNPILTDPRIRQALFLAIDRKRLVEELQEGLAGGITAQPWPSTSPAYDPTLDAAFYEPARAMALLREAGFAQSQPLALETYTGPLSPVAEVVQRNLKDVGVRVEIREMDAATFNARWRGRQFTDLFMASHAGANLLPLTLFQRAFPFQAVNPMHYESAEFTDIVSSIESLEPTSDAAKQEYKRFNTLFHEDPWLIPLMPQARVDLVSKNVRGFGDYFVTYEQEANFATIGLKV
jgi:peptide/nickel transport system substrate-binding protein